MGNCFQALTSVCSNLLALIKKRTAVCKVCSNLLALIKKRTAVCKVWSNFLAFIKKRTAVCKASSEILEFHYGQISREIVEALPEDALRSCELPCVIKDGVAAISLGGAESSQRPWGTAENEHRLDASVVLALSRALDRVEADPDVQALVLYAEGKYFCNGFDLKFFQAHPEGMDAVQAGTEALLSRLLVFPIPTVAALNGHATAAGAMLALALDFRVMDKDKGFMFVPGIDLGLTYSNGMSRLMEAKLPQILHRDFIVFGQRFTAASLLPHGVIDLAVPSEEVLSQATAKAQSLRSKAMHRVALGQIKTTMYHEAVAALRLESCAFRPMGFDVVVPGEDRPHVAPRTSTLQEGLEVLRRQSRKGALLDLEKLSKQPHEKSH